MSQQLPATEVLILLAAATALQLLFSLYLPQALLVDIPLIATLYIGWYSGPVAGALWGSAFGLMRDVTGILPLVGLNGFSKTLLGFLAAFLSRWVVLESLAGRMAVIGLVSLADGLLICWLMWLLGPGLPGHSLQLLGLQSLCTGVAGALLFRAYDAYRFPEKDFRQLK